MKIFEEKLVETYFYPIFVENCENVLKDQFEYYFRMHCSIDNYELSKDTTLGATFRSLERIACRNIRENIEILKCEEVYTNLVTGKSMLVHLAFELMEEFFRMLDIEGNVESILSVKYWDKKRDLVEAGILNSAGDFINKSNDKEII